MSPLRPPLSDRRHLRPLGERLQRREQIAAQGDVHVPSRRAGGSSLLLLSKRYGSRGVEGSRQMQLEREARRAGHVEP